MANAKFDIKSIEIPTVIARPLYAGVGAADYTVEYVRETVADVQKRFVSVQKDVSKNVKDFDFEPKALRDQATTVVSTRVDALSKDAKARRAAVESRVADLQADAKARASKLQTSVNDGVTTATETYVELAKRGETTIKRLRGDLAGVLDEAADGIEDAIEAVADVVDAPKTKGAKKSASRKSAAKSTSEAATTAKKAPAKKASAAKKTASTKATTAKKAASTTATDAKATAANATEPTSVTSSN